MEDNQEDRISDSNDDVNSNTNQQTTEPTPEIIFRNYRPQTSLLEGSYSTKKAQPGSITPYVKDKFQLLDDNEFYLKNDSVNQFNLNPKVLEPKKPDWDLKCRISKKMDKLDNETRRNIDKYIKSRKTRTRQ